MKLLTLEDYQKAGETFWPKYWYIAGELGEGAKAEDILRVMEAVGGVALKFALEEKEKEGPFGFNKKVEEIPPTDTATGVLNMSERKPRLEDSFGGSVETDIPKDAVWIDDAFYVKKTRFGLYTSVLKEPLGQHFITGLTEDGVKIMSRWHLKCLQDGNLEDYTAIIGSGIVGGKL